MRTNYNRAKTFKKICLPKKPEEKPKVLANLHYFRI